MTYAALGQPTSAQMSQMYAEMFRQQAQQRHDQEARWEQAEPGIVDKIHSQEAQGAKMWKEKTALNGKIVKTKTETGLYGDAVKLQDELATARRKSLWIVGGALAVAGAIVLWSRGSR